jgi:hypothetical protein
MIPFLMFVTSFLSGLALLSAIVRVAVAWLRAVEPSEALQLVLLNPTMLGAVVVWTLWGQLIAFVLGRGKGRDGGERTASAAEAGRDKERGLFRFGGRQRTGASRSFNVAAALLRVDREWIGIEAKREAASTGVANDSPLPGALVERFRDDVGRLLALRERLGFQAVIFSYHGASPLLAWAAEQGVVVLAPSLEQQDDPAFVIPGDGHPTPPANRAYADIIARTMQRSFVTAPSE